MQNNKPLVTVIIPIYNEKRDIGDCIESLKQQKYKPLEIIVVDDGSTDSTLKTLKKIKGIKLVKQNHLGPGAARNKGAKKAKGYILVFVDADMTFDKKFVAMLTRPIRKEKAIGTYSIEEYVSNNENRWARNWSINRGWVEGRMHPKKYPKTQKVFRAILKQKFDSVGGFDTEVGYTDDWTLAKKLKTEAVHAEGAVYYHRNPDSPGEAFQQARWMAKRPYKMGIIGRLFAMLRATLPTSFLIGTIKAIRHKSPSFLIFKLTIDYAIFLGIASMFIGRKRVK